MLYSLIRFEPNRRDGGWDRVSIETVGTLRAAELTATNQLPPASETTHSARRERHPFYDVRERNTGTKVACFETPIHIVPSVGDLGGTP